MNLSTDEFSQSWALALLKDQTERHGCRYHLLHTTSVFAALSFEDSSLDVIFVDGLHTYEGVSMDTNAWLRKLKRGGAFIFNDYDDPQFPGVSRAVDDFVAGQSLELIIGAEGHPPGPGNVAVILPL
jgi:ubiquinone/menaquinone biosynthesis C-methylase UbiE